MSGVATTCPYCGVGCGVPTIDGERASWDSALG